MTRKLTELSSWLMLGTPTLVPRAAFVRAMVNSKVTSTPVIPWKELLGDSVREAAVSFVEVRREESPTLHYHVADVIGVAVRGSGWLLTPGERDDIERHRVVAGDVVVIPRNSLHVFCVDQDESLEYAAVEFSDDHVDYQSHIIPRN